MTDQTAAEAGAPWTPGLPPAEPGVYEWRMPLRSRPHLHVVFLARMRTRGAGGTDVVSPQFDHWDGWSVHVPAGTEWRTAEDPAMLPKGAAYAGVRIEELDPEPCPFCGRRPALDGIQDGGGRGIFVNAAPFHYDRWSLRCCAWAGSPGATDPEKLVSTRADMLAAYRLGFTN